MDNRTKAVSVMLHSVGYVKAIDIVDSCKLPPDEHKLVVDYVIYKKNLGLVADEMCISYSTAKRKLKNALINIYLTVSQ